MLLLLLAHFIVSVSSELACEIVNGASVSSYGLGSAAADGIVYKEGQSSSSAQAFHCTCQSGGEQELNGEVRD